MLSNNGDQPRGRRRIVLEPKERPTSEERRLYCTGKVHMLDGRVFHFVKGFRIGLLDNLETKYQVKGKQGQFVDPYNDSTSQPTRFENLVKTYISEYTEGSTSGYTGHLAIDGQVVHFVNGNEKPRPIARQSSRERQLCTGTVDMLDGRLFHFVTGVRIGLLDNLKTRDQLKNKQGMYVDPDKQGSQPTRLEELVTQYIMEYTDGTTNPYTGYLGIDGQTVHIVEGKKQARTPARQNSRERQRCTGTVDMLDGRVFHFVTGVRIGLLDNLKTRDQVKNKQGMYVDPDKQGSQPTRLEELVTQYILEYTDGTTNPYTGYLGIDGETVRVDNGRQVVRPR